MVAAQNVHLVNLGWVTWRCPKTFPSGRGIGFKARVEVKHRELVGELNQAMRPPGVTLNRYGRRLAAREPTVDRTVPGVGTSPQGDFFTRWRYPDHARRKSPG